MTSEPPSPVEGDSAPGGEASHGIGGYLLGLGLAGGLTWLSFAVAGGTLVWGPGIPAALLAFAVAQMGVHLVFFLHITTGPEHTNNVLALVFGILIVALVLAGSLWIMAHLNEMMAHQMPMDGGF
jgi:cytochrome o ubiquinol oxidase operon protein cyoD